MIGKVTVISKKSAYHQNLCDRLAAKVAYDNELKRLDEEMLAIQRTCKHEIVSYDPGMYGIKPSYECWNCGKEMVEKPEGSEVWWG